MHFCNNYAGIFVRLLYFVYQVLASMDQSPCFRQLGFTCHMKNLTIEEFQFQFNGDIYTSYERELFSCVSSKIIIKKEENYDVNIFCSLNFVQCTHMFVLFFFLKFKEIQCFVSSIDVDYFFPVAFKYDNRDCIQLILKSSSRLFFSSLCLQFR